MQRRQLLRRAGAAVGIAVGSGVGSAAGGDADPRPDPLAGTRPNENVPTTETGALGQPPFEETSEVPAGDWILHDNGVVGMASRATAVDFADNTVHTYVVDGEEFVLDGFEDWTYDPERTGILFEYVTPPKPKGYAYEVRWDVESTVERWDGFVAPFPFWNRIEIVGRR